MLTSTKRKYNFGLAKGFYAMLKPIRGRVGNIEGDIDRSYQIKIFFGIFGGYFEGPMDPCYRVTNFVISIIFSSIDNKSSIATLNNFMLSSI